MERDIRIVSEAWVAESTTARGSEGYGYHWWTGRSYRGSHPQHWVSAQGFGGQQLFIVPDLGLVVAMTAWLDPDSDHRAWMVGLFDGVVLQAIAD